MGLGLRVKGSVDQGSPARELVSDELSFEAFGSSPQACVWAAVMGFYQISLARHWGLGFGVLGFWGLGLMVWV